MSDSNPLNSTLAVTGSVASNGNRKGGSWYEAMAEAWGEALDRQAGRIESLSQEVGQTELDTPAKINELTAESLRMGFLSNSSHTSLTSVASALETMARKQ